MGKAKCVGDIGPRYLSRVDTMAAEVNEMMRRLRDS